VRPRYSAYEGPGAPGAPMYQTTLVLTNAQIKALPTTPVGPLVAGEAGILLVPVYATARLNAAAGAYTNVDVAAGITVGWSVGGGVAAGLAAIVAAIIGAAVDNLVILPQQGVSGATAGKIGSGLSILGANAAAGNWTGGNAANTLEITVYYLAYPASDVP